MAPIPLLAGQFLIVVAIVVAVAWFARRRLGGSWALWAAGAGTFVASQVLRVPMLAGAEMVGLGALAVALLAVVTSGIFEEGARYLALRWVVTRARQARDGVMFGLGHGGIEAVLLLGLAAVSGIFLLVAGDTVVEAARGAGQDAVEALEAQIDALETVTAFESFLAVYERALAMVAHVAMTLLVLRAVTQRAVRWLVAAVLYHMAINGIVISVAQQFGIVAAEVAMTGVAVVSALVIRAAWRNRADWYEDPRPEVAEGAEVGEGPSRS